MKLNPETIQAVSRVLSASCDVNATESVLRISTGETSAENRTPGIVVTITSMPDDSYVLSAQTVHGYFELHHVQRCVVVEPDEVIFVAEEGDKISGVIIGATGVCSSFANVDRTILSADFTQLEPALLLAAMQLGLVELLPA